MKFNDQIVDLGVKGPVQRKREGMFRVMWLKNVLFQRSGKVRLFKARS